MKRRGQSFETMMLVISVIVAVAILGILLGFLPGVQPIGLQANTVIPELVQKANQQGYGMQLKEDVIFNDGDRIYRANARGETPIADDAIIFSCIEGICSSGTDRPLTITDTSIVVNSKVKGTVAVCVGVDKKYRVIVGQVTQDVSQQAETQCGLA